MSQFLIELLVEEIPAGMQTDGEAAFKKIFETFLSDNGIGDVEVFSASMSSRIAVWCEGLPERTEDVQEENRGPKVGAPEQALNGFMKGQGISDASMLEQRETPKGTFYFYNKTVEGRPVKELLAEQLPQMIKNIPWPKSMRWADGDMTFVRPLANVLCVLDGKTVEFDVDQVASNNKTRGHFFMRPDFFEVSSIDSYMNSLEENFVMLDRTSREEEIEKQLQEKASAQGLSVVENRKLIEEVAGLIEWPYAVISSVDKEFLELPREVLIKTMVADQRYFALEDETGNMSNFFIGISNMADKHGHIAKGYTKVLTSRFEDARFYWETDRKHTLESRTSKLASIVFQKDLGTVADKMNRVAALMPTLSTVVEGLNVKNAQRAAQLAKCDLTSGVVGEFAELQGTIGAYLAKADGEDLDVVDAIRHQYKNDNFENVSQTAIALILADRLDTLVGFFGINQPPTGSKDPFALRRAALTIIRLAMQHNLRFSLKNILSVTAINYGDTVLQLAQSEVSEKLVEFILDRIKVILREEGIDHDIVDAVLANGSDDIVDNLHRTRALSAFMQGEAGQDLHQAFKRANNILSGVHIENGVVETLLAEPAEKNLFTACQAVSSKLDGLIQGESYEEAMRELATLREPLNHFYDDVQVMAEDESVKKNRISLLNMSSGLFLKVANLARLAG